MVGFSKIIAAVSLTLFTTVITDTRYKEFCDTPDLFCLTTNSFGCCQADSFCCGSGDGSCCPTGYICCAKGNNCCPNGSTCTDDGKCTTNDPIWPDTFTQGFSYSKITDGVPKSKPQLAFLS